MDIYLTASQFGKYPGLTTSTSVNNCYIFKQAHFNSRSQIVINPNDFLPSLQLSQQQLLNGISIWISEVSGRTIANIDGHYINTVVYDTLRGSSYLSQPVELQNPSTGLVNIIYIFSLGPSRTNAPNPFGIQG